MNRINKGTPFLIEFNGSFLPREFGGYYLLYREEGAKLRAPFKTTKEVTEIVRTKLTYDRLVPKIIIDSSIYFDIVYYINTFNLNNDKVRRTYNFSDNVKLTFFKYQVLALEKRKIDTDLKND